MSKIFKIKVATKLGYNLVKQGGWQISFIHQVKLDEGGLLKWEK